MAMSYFSLCHNLKKSLYRVFTPCRNAKTHPAPYPWRPTYLAPKPMQCTSKEARSLVSSLLPEPDGDTSQQPERAKRYEDWRKNDRDRVPDGQDQERHCAAISIRDNVVVKVIFSDGLERHDAAASALTRSTVSHLVAPRCQVGKHRGVRGFHHLSAPPPPPLPPPMTVLKKLPGGPSPL
jgi:hypothetical protein